MEYCQVSQMKLGYKKASELLFSSILPATHVVLLTLFADLLIYLERKAFILFPRKMLLALFLLKLCYFS